MALELAGAGGAVAGAVAGAAVDGEAGGEAEAVTIRDHQDSGRTRAVAEEGDHTVPTACRSRAVCLSVWRDSAIRCFCRFRVTRSR